MGIKIFHSVIILSLLILINFLRTNVNKPSVEIKKQDNAINFDQHFLRFIGFSQKRLLSTLIYSQTFLTSDQDHYEGQPGLNWMHLRFLSSLQFDPKFYEASLLGGLYVSIIKDDVESGNKLYELGLLHYSYDFKLNYYLAFNYLFELKNPEVALKYYFKILEDIKDREDNPIIILRLTNLIKHIKNEDERSYMLEFIGSAIQDMKSAPQIQEQIIKKLKQETLNN